MDEPFCPACRQRDATIAALEKRVADLQALVEEAQRAGKRQAAPFAKGEPKRRPKRPGRKKGERHGKHGHRPPPPPEAIDETHEAPLPDACPDCGGTLQETHIDPQFQTDIPKKPIVRKINIHCGQCERCGKPCRGRHPLQTSQATGAAASQLGPDAQAAIVVLNKQAGLPHGKIADVFDQLFGIPVTRGACAQIVLRAGQRLEPAYQDILEQLKASPHITPDETGWRVGGHPAWLHVGVGEQATAYFIDPHRSADALQRAIGIDWEGIFTHDAWSSYDRFLEAIHQRCVAHPLARARRLLDIQVGAARRFPRQVIDLFQESLAVRDRCLAGHRSAARLYRAHEDYTARLLDLCAHPRVNALNQRLADHLAKHGEQWFLFLIDPSIPATNYRAEQALRPAVVNRKVWGGNRTWAGASAQMVITSVLTTCKQHAQSAFTYVSQTLRNLATPLFSFLQPRLA